MVPLCIEVKPTATMPTSQRDASLSIRKALSLPIGRNEESRNLRGQAWVACSSANVRIPEKTRFLNDS